MGYRLLIVDDEKNMCRSLEILLSGEGNYKVSSVNNAQDALKFIEKNDIDLIITDLTMPGMGGMDLLKNIKENHPSIQVIMMTAYSTVQSAIEALKIGAYDYLMKPFSDDDLLRSVKKAMEVTELKNENMFLKEMLNDKEQKNTIFVANSPAMKEIRFLMERAAGTPSNILITGESGTGKEVLARLIHQISPGAKNRFFAINCASIPESLLESELFGHERGAFTGAIKTKKGKFELAPDGVIFLDEIGEMSPSLQAKLLRVLEEKKFERLGGLEQISYSSRIVAATNKDLKTLIKEGKFREDLYYRLNVIHIELPPLRERKEDIPELVNIFINTKCIEFGIKTKQLSPEAMDKLLSYDYPGNIRELSNIIERALIISKGNTIRVNEIHLPEHEIYSDDIGTGTKIKIENGFQHIDGITKKLEEEIIKEALKIHSTLSNTELAALLGTTRRILEARMKVYGIDKAQ
ncbi:MAG: sigma-54 dependent transcriptional regulator, partial [Proteobacteria bacterium]|nr:sigma-54 dependent transcriptional regulator [Pseudomonadota bacterium]